jgi:PAS domain S-box-containing protein
MEANKAARLFCDTWFRERDAGRAAGFLSDDVQFVGTGEGEYACGKEGMSSYIREDIEEIAEPFEVGFSVINEQFLSDTVYTVFAEMVLKNSLYIWRLRANLFLQKHEGAWKVCNIHFSEPGSCQRGNEHYPQAMAMENIAKQQNELLSDSVAGGMMGGYIEPGFPFYFINRRMLDYLGYGNEEEFVADIKGMVSNCMHPGDREMVDGEVDRQLEAKGEYVVEYRMKKKNGSYIWVHDVGKMITAENGKQAIVSVCIDITTQKQTQNELLHIYNNIPGAVFRCRSDEGFSIIEANDGLYEFLGYTREEFAAMGNKMSAVVHPDDLEDMVDALNARAEDGKTIHSENRLICKGGVVKWISIKAQLLKEDGEQYFYCVFVDVTEEKQLQERVKELYEKEISYFAEIYSAGESVQGKVNVTQNRVESYFSTADVAVGHVGDSYDEIMENLAASAVDEEYGKAISGMLNREKVLADYAAGKVDYHFDFLRRQNDGGSFWGSTDLRSCLNPETGDVIIFFYTFDITEQKLQEQLLKKIAGLEYDIITEIVCAMTLATRRVFVRTSGAKNMVSAKGGNSRM